MVRDQQPVEEDIDEEPAVGVEVDLPLRCGRRQGCPSLGVPQALHHWFDVLSVAPVRHEVQVGELLAALAQTPQPDRQIDLTACVEADGNPTHCAHGQSSTIRPFDDLPGLIYEH